MLRCSLDEIETSDTERLFTAERSVLSFDDEPGKGPQPIRRRPEFPQRVQRGGELALGLLNALIHPKQAGVGVLSLTRVLVRRLAELLGGARHVQHIIDNLERQTQMAAEV